MDNAQLVAVQSQRVLQRRLDIAANNLANVATAGFKAETLVQAEDAQAPAAARDRPRDIEFVRDVTVSRDFAQGPITVTGAPFDVAIEGSGFFTVQGPNGPLYTRDGGFTLDAAGRLMTSNGLQVLGEGGPIVFDPQGQSPAIAADGSIQVSGVAVGRLALADFARPGALKRTGDNLWDAGQQAIGPFKGKIAQGAREGSNVSAVTQMTELIEISRAYESAARIVSGVDDLRKTAIDRIGRV